MFNGVSSFHAKCRRRKDVSYPSVLVIASRWIYNCVSFFSVQVSFLQFLGNTEITIVLIEHCYANFRIVIKFHHNRNARDFIASMF